MAGTDIAIDLGTSSVKIYLEKKGIILNEPAVVAVDTATDTILAVGDEAYRMIGRTSPRTAVIRPLCNGVISDFLLAQELIRYYLKKIHGPGIYAPGCRQRSLRHYRSGKASGGRYYQLHRRAENLSD